MGSSLLPPTVRELSRASKFKSRFESSLGQFLPKAYKKFWGEWKLQKPLPVHFIPEEGEWKRNEETGEVKPVQNIPLPLKMPPEIHQGIWGGEAVVQGFYQNARGRYLRRRVPHFWVPQLKRTVIKSEVLNTYLSLNVTNRALDLIHSNYGFDHYLLKTKACDLVSLLALKLKKKILLELLDGCPKLANNKQKQLDVLEEYGHYLEKYTPEEIEWYGLSWEEALEKISKIKANENKPVPLKLEFRQNLINELKAKAAEKNVTDSPSTSSWLSKVNVFGKKETT